MKKEIVIEITQIIEKQGEITATELVRHATRETSALHGQFEWDDTEAAHQYRLNQARNILRRVRLIIEETEQKLVHVPAINHPKSEGSYKPIEAVVRIESDFEAAMRAALANLKSAERAVAELRAAASESKDSDRLTALGVALQAMSTAREALQTLH